MNSPRLKWARRITALIAVAVFAWVLVDASREGFELPPNMALRFAFAIPISTMGLLAAGMSWSVLVGGSLRQNLAAFGTSLPLRHLPMGGLGQIAGLTGLSIAGGVTRRRASQAGPVFLVVTAAGASLVATPVLWETEAPPLLRLGVGLSVAASLLLVVRGRLLLGWLGRWWRIAEGSDELPLARAVLWSCMAAVGAGGAFSVLFQGASDLIAGVGGFAAAWLAGFLFVIAPAGLGAREAVLVALWPNVDPAAVLAASLIHRVSTLAGEGLLFAAGLVLSRNLGDTDVERTA